MDAAAWTAIGLVAAASPSMPNETDASNVSDTEANKMDAHLRGLGYLE